MDDAPALAQAKVDVTKGTGVAIEAADVAHVRDHWAVIPDAGRLGRRSARVIRQNVALTAVYIVVGNSLTIPSILAPVWAAAAQSLLDVAIVLNSARLQGRGSGERATEAPCFSQMH